MTAWTPAMDEILKAGWVAGLSEPQIAAKVGLATRTRFSRHSISSRRRRLGLPERGAEVRRDTLVLSNKSRRVEPVTIPLQPPKDVAAMKVFECALPGTTPRPWLTRGASECAWPVKGSGADTFSCCAPVTHLTKPYCDRHLVIRSGVK